ncbi:MAG: diacylglycerol/lipid kinase family protein [Intrasporangium sp.]|uniref:diacylglycerol/lipid kinase family protein n=1 Tax=Intrasporangium sp. TaxID=1925024 RepID=UPI003F81D99F
MLSEWLPWIVVGGVVVLGLIALALLGPAAPRPLSGKGVRSRRPHRNHFRQGDPPELPVKHAAIVLNPTKVADAAFVRAEIRRICAAEGWGEPRFYETTIEDPGGGQARQAAEEGAAVVCSLGGDGTVRMVASALVGTETALGILPAGTGNLLARNLDMPVGSLETAMRVALTGRNRRIDVGELVIGRPQGDAAAAGNGGGPNGAAHVASDGTGNDDPVPAEPERHRFLVMTGIGMDAAIMQGTNANLKATVGWGAYVVSGVKHLVSPEFRASFRLDADAEFKRRARAIIIGNCGRLLGGLVLMPDARVDDQRLDVVIASPKGLVGWAPVIARALTRQRKGHSTLDHKVCEEIRVRTDRLLPVQVDGDVVAEANEITASVLPASLTVRVAHP